MAKSALQVEGLPSVFGLIARDEILQRLNISSAACPLGKRTPGDVRQPFDSGTALWMLMRDRSNSALEATILELAATKFSFSILA